MWRKLSGVWANGWLVLRARWYFRHATALGTRVRLWGRAAVRNDGTMMIGERVRIVGTIVPVELYAGPGGALVIGDQTFINYGCSIAALERIEIGPRCNIGTYVIIMDNDFHRLEPERRNETPPSAPVIIEENVWLGARVTVLRGVRIGAGSVIGANSVVVKDIPPRSIAAGSPARIIRSLDD